LGVNLGAPKGQEVPARHVTLVTNPIISLEWWKDRIVITVQRNIYVAICDTSKKNRVPTIFYPRNSRSFQGVFKGFLLFFKVSLNISNELRDSLNQSLNINWTGIAYYILSTLHVHVHVCLVGAHLFIPTLILPLELFCVLSISRLLVFCALTFQWMS
jgi:hypothetical protein